VPCADGIPADASYPVPHLTVFTMPPPSPDVSVQSTRGSQADRGGEDAYFVTAARGGAFGVADGVGGWTTEGVDVAAYARGICGVARDTLAAPGSTISKWRVRLVLV
jgi:hypothetical protein